MDGGWCSRRAVLGGLAGTAFMGVTPATAGAGEVSSARLTALLDSRRDDPHPDLKGVVVLRHGRGIAEAYYNGDDATTLHDIRSATKSLTSLLMGIAIDRGRVAGVDAPIARYLPSPLPSGWEAITIRDLLTMRSGLAADDTDPASPGNEDTLDEAGEKTGDWAGAALAVPVREPPGRTYQYCSLNAFLVGLIVECATGQSLDRLAQEALFGPLGIAAHSWRQLPGRHGTGQGNLSITARDAATIGQMVLNQGTHNGRRVISQRWLSDSLARIHPIAASDPYADFYGYMWYAKDEPLGDGRIVPVHFASGNGGNKIYVVPSLDLVVAVTSSAYGKGYGQRRSQDILLSILKAMP
ncbi:serine hydrolase domain-containing protein [Nitrospirillum viridazoti]|uniref:Serine hydrolase n=1 Tax=Nitrospirillum viridazoti CBAmc TaxID=1441467 RepID=A0A248JPQ8_9PROT|nr:serine hydrolase [Nitrospirillum amazonense]ASG20481.1 serine hydrolase [Nitrospirillum amazonense CBAmc]TWB34889.1 CubicO group peptidase (beta-lactamase class C family) [Nitrospirillum amazonense]